jgi:hypothetical protein
MMCHLSNAHYLACTYFNSFLPLSNSQLIIARGLLPVLGSSLLALLPGVDQRQPLLGYNSLEISI